MCGISVVIALHGTSLDDGTRSIAAMLDESLDRISHRGPDSRGVWINDDKSVGTCPPWSRKIRGNAKTE